MAKLSVFAVYDSKVQEFASPFFMRTRGEALRGWQQVANDSSTDIFKWPEDYSLMELAEFDSVSGLMTPVTPPLNLGLASAFKRPTDGRTETFEQAMVRTGKVEQLIERNNKKKKA